MRESPVIVAAFVAHHISLNPQEIYIFLDQPDPEIESLLASIPRLIVTVCDDDYWATMGKEVRPTGVVERQLFNAEQARKRSSADWLIHIDSDEFIMEGQTSLQEQLSKVSAAYDLVRLRNLERVLIRGQQPANIFDGLFRDQIPKGKRLAAKIYGDAAPYLHCGFSGYNRGKTATRISSHVSLALHPGNVGGAAAVPTWELEEARLLHFDGFTPLHWTSKMLRRLANAQLGGSSARRRQMYYMNDAETRDQRFALYDLVNTLSDATLTSLRDMDLIDDRRFDPSQAIEHLFPGQDFDLSVSAFNQRMVAANPDWFVALDLAP